MSSTRIIFGRAMPWAAAAILTGCVPTLVNNPPRDANKAVPDNFNGNQATSNEAPKGGENVGQQNWKEFFPSHEVQDLIELALKNNQELNIRMQEMIIAQSEVTARRGDYLPKVSARVGAGVDKAGEFTRQGRNDETSGLSSTLGDFGFGVVASWEVDVWGKLRNAAKAADYRYMASIEGKNFVVTQLVSEIARSYYELLALDNQIDVLQRNIKIQEDALEVVKMEKAAARVTELAVQRFEAEVLKNKSRLYDFEQQRTQVENRINFLVGRYPQPVARNPQELNVALPSTIQTGLPSQLLENRPDVRQAELELEAAKMDVSAARKNFYPSVTIDADLGFSAFNISHLLSTPASIVFGLAGGLTAPLINRTGIEATYRSANARQLQAVFNYERTLLQAFTDVANQVVKFDKLSKGYDLQSQQVKKLADSIEVSTVLFKSARADYMEVLMTRRDALDAEMELIETKLKVLQSTVGIYQALGGGWQSSKS